MRSSKDVESYLLRMGRPFSEASDGTYIVRVEAGSVALKIDPPLVLARLDVGTRPATHREALYEHLLELNASSLVHAAYGLDGDRIVLSAALELENLDYNELDAILAEIDLALAQQIEGIRALATGEAPRDGSAGKG